jgi:hypothetical protein
MLHAYRDLTAHGCSGRLRLDDQAQHEDVSVQSYQMTGVRWVVSVASHQIDDIG